MCCSYENQNVPYIIIFHVIVQGKIKCLSFNICYVLHALLGIHNGHMRSTNHYILILFRYYSVATWNMDCMFEMGFLCRLAHLLDTCQGCVLDMSKWEKTIRKMKEIIFFSGGVVLVSLQKTWR